jgi:hypothetical protein
VARGPLQDLHVDGSLGADVVAAHDEELCLRQRDGAPIDHPQMAVGVKRIGAIPRGVQRENRRVGNVLAVAIVQVGHREVQQPMVAHRGHRKDLVDAAVGEVDLEVAGGDPRALEADREQTAGIVGLPEGQR